MADKSNTTNATELLNKICSGGTITPQDLGTPTANTREYPKVCVNLQTDVR